MSVEYDSLLSLLVDFRSSYEERYLQGGRTSKCVPVRVRTNWVRYTEFVVYCNPESLFTADQHLAV